MENTTPSNPLFAVIQTAVDAHINSLIEARLKTINEAAITEYVQRAVTAKFNDMNVLPTDYITEKDVQRLLGERLSETAINAQLMATLDRDFESKMRSIALSVVQTHEQDVTHLTNDDVRDVVDDMDLVSKLNEKLTDKIEDIVQETDLSSTLESAIETYLEDNHYANHEYVDEKMESLSECDGFTSAVRDVVCGMQFETRATNY